MYAYELGGPDCESCHVYESFCICEARDMSEECHTSLRRQGAGTWFLHSKIILYIYICIYMYIPQDPRTLSDIWEESTEIQHIYTYVHVCLVRCLRRQDSDTLTVCTRALTVCTRARGASDLYDCMKREAFTWKEMHLHRKRCIYMKRDAFVWREMHLHQKRCIYMKRDALIWKEMHSHGKRRIHMKRDAFPWKEMHLHEKRCIYVKRDAFMWKIAPLERCRALLRRCIQLWQTSSTFRQNSRAPLQTSRALEAIAIHVYERALKFCKSQKSAQQRARSLQKRYTSPQKARIFAKAPCISAKVP